MEGGGKSSGRARMDSVFFLQYFGEPFFIVGNVNFVVDSLLLAVFRLHYSGQCVLSYSIVCSAYLVIV